MVTATESFEVFSQSLENKTAQQKAQLFHDQSLTINQWDPIEQGRFYHIWGLYRETTEKDILAAKEAFSQSIAIFKAHNQPNEYWVQSLQDRSYMDYLLTNDPGQYCEDRRAAVSVARKTELPLALTSSLTHYAFCFESSLEQLATGLNLLKEATKVAIDNNLSTQQSAMVYNATAALYRSNYLHQQAYDYLTKAYQGWAKERDSQDMFNMQHALVGESIALRDWQKADSHVKQLFQLTHEHKEFTDFKFFAIFNQGRVAFARQQFHQAVNDFRQALKLRDTTSEQNFIDEAEAMLLIAAHRAGIEKPLDLAISIPSKLLSALKDPLKKQLEIVLIWSQGDHQRALANLWSINDEYQSEKLAFMKNNTIALSMSFNQELSEFQQRVLKDQLAIKELELEREKNKEQFVKLTRTILVLAFLILLLITLHLYQSRKSYRTKSRYDLMTGLANRSTILSQARQLLKESKKQNSPFGLVIFDIDDFKQVNDHYGHIVGDAVIKQVASIARSTIDSQFKLGRIGGEEFLLLIPNCNENELCFFSEKVRKAIAESPTQTDGKTITQTVSLGLALSDPHGDHTLAELMKRADQALYQAKNKGKNQFQKG